MARLYLFVHVLSAIVWIGGSIVLAIMSARVKRSNDPGRMAAFGEDAGFIGSRIFAPASGLLFLSGIAVVFASYGASGFKQTWIALGVVGWIIVAGIGGGVLGPQSQRLKRLIAESGPNHPDVRRISARIERLGRLELVLFLLLVADMTFKPAGG
jgi:uncharacterized membrane protein